MDRASMLRLVLAAAGIGLASVSTALPAQYKSGKDSGVIIARISDGFPAKCINGATDAISVQFVKIILSKDFAFFARTKNIGIYIETLIEGSSNSTSDKVQFPRSFKIGVEDFADGLVRIAFERKILSRFKLKYQGSEYSTAEFTIKYVNFNVERDIVKVIRVLADVTDELPIPGNIFSDEFKMLSKFGRKLIDGLSKGKEDPEEIAPDGFLQLTFSPNGDCSQGEEQTGPIAIIKSSPGREEDGIADVSLENTYCFRFRGEPTKYIEFGKKSGNECPETSYKLLRSPHYLIVVQAYVAPTSSTDVKRTVLVPTPEPGRVLTAWKPGRDVGDTAAFQWKGIAPDVGATEGQFRSKLQAFVSKPEIFDFAGPDAKELFASGKTITMFDLKTSPDARILSDFGITRDRVDPERYSTILKQQVPSLDAAVQDTLIALGRCAYYGIPRDNCL